MVFTVNVGGEVRLGPVPGEPNEQSYDLAVIAFGDDGTFSNPGQLSAAAAAITHARNNPNGAIVVVFIHGWHHNADWNIATDGGDSHFRAFRQTLAFITLREAERYLPHPGGRRVVGVYIGWNGDPADSWLTGAGPLTHLSFWDRYSVAKHIGDGAPMREVVRTIVEKTKQRLPDEGHAAPAVESPVILIGHSMGALMLESAFLALIRDPAAPLVYPSAGEASIIDVRRDGKRVRFPDVLIALNSAADSSIHHEIRRTLVGQRFTKTVGEPDTRYAGPLLMSATSSADSDTKVVWRAANLPWIGRTTDGHDATLFTHRLESDQRQVTCNPRGFVDFGQNWHCLRAPEPPNVATPRIAVDLPIRDRAATDDVPPFARYVLAPLGNMDKAHLTWVFQVPPQIVVDHNDIFNPRASSLMLALIQTSGAIMSLAADWESTFEADA